MTAEPDVRPEDQSLPAPAPARLTPPARVVLSQELLQGSRELLIDHGGEIYRLRMTRNGKLILHK